MNSIRYCWRTDPDPGAASWSPRDVGLVASTFDQHGLQSQRLTERGQTVGAQRPGRATTSASRRPRAGWNLHHTVEPDDRGVDSLGRQVFPDQVPGTLAIVCRPGPATVESRPPGRTRTSTIRTPREPLGHRASGLERQIATGDAEIQLSGTDVRWRCRRRPKKFDVVDRIEDGQVSFGSVTTPVTGLRGSRRPIRSERPCWGDGNAQPPVTASGRCRRGSGRARPSAPRSVQQLADLATAPRRFVLGGHPDLAGLFQDLLADGVNAGVRAATVAAARRPCT